MSDTAWLTLCFILVLLMQAGFTCLESGQVRSKNSVNVALKNIADFAITFVVYWIIGFGLMYGQSINGLFGSSLFFYGDNKNDIEISFLLFQTVFASTAVTLISGAVAERMKFTAYILMSMFVASILYPVFGHWAWSGYFNENNIGFLQSLGFIDFAGSTVVHSLGGWVALAAIMIIGPRMDRFNTKTGEVYELHGSNYSLAMVGAFFLIIGWIGFNAGSALSFSDNVPKIILNTMLAASSGGVLILILNQLRVKKIESGSMMNGVLAGLVAVTAGCNLFYSKLI